MLTNHPMLTNHRRALVCCLSGAALIGVLLAVPGPKGSLQQLDDRVYRVTATIRIAPLTRAAKAFDLLGGVWVNWPLRAAAALLLACRRRWVQLTAFAVAVASSEYLIGKLKAGYARSRPPHALVSTSGSSFPSGHAVAIAVTAVGLVIVLVSPGPRRSVWQLRAVVFAFVMALSRAYLAAHWLSDVVAGVLLRGGLAIGWPAVLQSVRGVRTQVVTPAGMGERWP